MATQIFHFSNTGISSGQRFYLKDDVSGIFVRNLNIDSNFPVVASNLVYNTGNQTISGTKTFNVAPILSGNPLITGINLSSYITTGQTGVFYPRNNPSGFISSAGLTPYALANQVVYTTGNQTISGNKTFAQGTVFGDSTQDNIFVVSGNQVSFGVRPTVNGTGVLLSGEGIASLITIQDEGSSQGSASTLNFIGGGVSVSVGGSTAAITINGGGGTSLVSPPASPNAFGISGQIALDQNYSYYCISNNNWRRSAIGSW